METLEKWAWERDVLDIATPVHPTELKQMACECYDALKERTAEVELLRAIVEELRRRLDAVDKLLLEALDVSEGISPEGKEFDDALAAKATKEDD